MEILRKWIRAFGILLLACGFLSFVLGDAAVGQTRSTLGIAPQAGLSGLDPHSAKAFIDIVLANQIYDTLITFDERQNPQPALATAWKQVDDTTWELTLRENVKFHDGTPFNAEAVKYNLERAIDPKRAGRASVFNPFIASATVVDEHRVRLTTKGKVPYLTFIVGFNFLGMVSPTAAEKYGADYARNPVGTGPFKFVKWVEGQTVDMVANDEYWNGKPKLAGIHWRLIPSESARALALQAGEVDVIANPPADLLPRLTGGGEYELVSRPTNSWIGIWTNPAVPTLTDINVRLAIFHSINQKAIVDNILKKIVQPAYQLLGPAVFGMFPDDQVPPGGFYPYDPALSKQLLAKSGWVDKDGDGFVKKDGKKLTIIVQTPDGRYFRDRQIAEATVAYMQAVGIDAVLKVVEFPTHSTSVTQHKVEVFVLGWYLPEGYPEPLFYSVFHSAPGGGQATWAQWQNAEADTLIEQVRNEPDSAARVRLYQSIMKIFMDNAIIKPLYRESIIYVTTKSVSGFEVLSSNVPAKMVGTEKR